MQTIQFLGFREISLFFTDKMRSAFLSKYFLKYISAKENKYWSMEIVFQWLSERLLSFNISKKGFSQSVFALKYVEMLNAHENTSNTVSIVCG